VPPVNAPVKIAPDLDLLCRVFLTRASVRRDLVDQHELEPIDAVTGLLLTSGDVIGPLLQPCDQCGFAPCTNKHLCGDMRSALERRRRTGR
jgi:hypothetical protein